MQVSFKISLSMELLHKLTMQKLVINEDVERVYDEDSEEYTELCNDYCKTIGFSREEDKDMFDKELMLLLAKDGKQASEEKIKTIIDVAKSTFMYKEEIYSVIMFGGYIINPKDFCAIKVGKIDVSINKK